jgi:hypothetical protein
VAKICTKTERKTFYEWSVQAGACVIDNNRMKEKPFVVISLDFRREVAHKHIEQIVIKEVILVHIRLFTCVRCLLRLHSGVF